MPLRGQIAEADLILFARFVRHTDIPRPGKREPLVAGLSRFNRGCKHERGFHVPPSVARLLVEFVPFIEGLRGVGMNVDFIAGLSDIPVAAPALVFHVIIHRPAVDGVAR